MHHIILLPKFRSTKKRSWRKSRDRRRVKCCVVVWVKANSAAKKSPPTNPADAFGHPCFRRGRSSGGSGQRKAQVQSRSVKLGYAQRSAAHYASADALEAAACGEAVRAPSMARGGSA
jgi:hypothetical protein